MRAAATKEENWPPPIREFVTNQQSEVFHPAPFSPPLEPREIGPLFEIRQYTLTAGSIPGLIERWSEKIEGRQKFSPLVAGMYTEFGALNKWVHIWAYKDANERNRVRTEAAADRQWPARNPPGVVVKQENSFVMPVGVLADPLILAAVVRSAGWQSQAPALRVQRASIAARNSLAPSCV